MSTRRRRRSRTSARAAASAAAEAAAEAAADPRAAPAADTDHSRNDSRDNSRDAGKAGAKVMPARPRPRTILGVPRLSFLIMMGGLMAVVVMFIFSAVAEEPTAGSDLKGVVSYADQGRRLLTPGETFTAYNSDPPTSGPHYATGVAPGIYDTPPDPARLLPLLEQGGIVIYYRPDRLDAAGIEALRNNVQALLDLDLTVVLTVHESLSAPIVATAWRHSLAVDSVSDKNLALFVRPAQAGGFYGRYAFAPVPGL